MDEQQLSELFRTAVRETPPPSFDRDDVLAASRRATARRRRVIAGGTAGGAVLAGAALAGIAVLPPGAGSGVAAPVSTDAVQRVDQPRPRSLPRAGGQAEPRSLLAPDSPPCAPADPELAARLVTALEERGVTPTNPARPVPDGCPDSARAAGVPVPGGTVYVLVGPEVDVAARSASVPVGGGQQLTVLSVPDRPGQPVPLAGRLAELARDLA